LLTCQANHEIRCSICSCLSWWW